MTDFSKNLGVGGGKDSRVRIGVLVQGGRCTRKSDKNFPRAGCDCAHKKVQKIFLARSAIVHTRKSANNFPRTECDCVRTQCFFFKNSYNLKIYYNFRRYLTNYNLTESTLVLG